MRKTIEISNLIDYVNGILAAETNSEESKTMRAGATLVLEQALMKTGNYAGFRNLSNHDLPAHITPGIRCDENGALPYPERFENVDDTRRHYFKKI